MTLPTGLWITAAVRTPITGRSRAQAHLDAARAAAPPSPAQGIVDDLLRRDEDPGPAG